MNLDRNKIYAIGVIIFVVLAGFAYNNFFNDAGTTLQRVEQSTTMHTTIEPYIHESPVVQEQEPTEITVFISGEVNYPNVFTMAHDARIVDVVELAGGLTDYADLNRVNLAGHLEDAMHIIIPTIGEEAVLMVDAFTVTVNSNLININTATQQELTTLPGVGPAISQNIINHRENHGRFTRIEDIMNVTRIGPAIFDNIRDLITV